MADVIGFQGLRYNIDKVGDLAQVTAPPYDVIGAAQQDALHERHPQNVIRLILAKGSLDPDAPGNRYAQAAQCLADWRADGTLLPDDQLSLYVYHQTFDVEGNTYTRRGFMGAVRLEEFGAGCVYPHERTMSGPKQDRLNLTKTTRTNLSPIFSLYPDEDNAVMAALEAARPADTVYDAVDELGTRHELWVIADAAVLDQVHRLLADRPIFIADGHHRYETACNYRRWLEEIGGPLPDDHPAQRVLMTLVSMADPGLAILPTHRLITGLKSHSLDSLLAPLTAHFSCQRVGTGQDAARRALTDVLAGPDDHVFGIGSQDGDWAVVRLTDGDIMHQLAGELSPAQRGLDVAILHRLILDHLLGPALAGEGGLQPSYVHLAQEVSDSLADGSAQAALLVRPATLQQVRQVAGALEKMPPKSTYFYPKLLSGLVIKPLA